MDKLGFVTTSIRSKSCERIKMSISITIFRIADFELWMWVRLDNWFETLTFAYNGIKSQNLFHCVRNTNSGTMSIILGLFGLVVWEIFRHEVLDE